MSEEVAFTMGVSQDQTLFAPTVYGISSYESNSMKSSNPNSGIYKADTSRTLDLNGGNPTCNQGGMAVIDQGGDASERNECIVRRLTPTECERLQGFPDGWTKIANDTADTRRYKQMGNSMAVPVMRMLGRRIEAYDILHGDEVKMPPHAEGR